MVEAIRVFDDHHGRIMSCNNHGRILVGCARISAQGAGGGRIAETGNP
jgi:hypothetical protein